MKFFVCEGIPQRIGFFEITITISQKILARLFDNEFSNPLTLDSDLALVVECEKVFDIILDEGVLFVSDNVRKSIVQTVRSNVQFVQGTGSLFVVNGKAKFKDFYLVKIPVLDGMLDPTLSKIKIEEKNKVRIVSIDSIALRNTDVQIFRLREFPSVVFISEKLYQFWTARQFDGVDFIPADEFSGTIHEA